MEKDKTIKTIKSLFSNVLLDRYWDNYDEYERKTLKEDLDKICQCFIDGGFIIGFTNIFDMSNSEKNMEDGLKIIDTYLKFEEKTPHVVLKSSIVTTKKVDIVINNDFGVNQDSFREEILQYKKMEGVEEIINFLDIKREKSKELKELCIRDQNFEPAANWRDIERFIQELIKKISTEGSIIQRTKKK